MRQAFKLDAFMQNFENLFRFMELKQEPPLKIPSVDYQLLDQTNDEWLKEGKIELENVSLAYGESSKNALKNISITIEPKTVISCVGRASSGKSSLVAALLNLVKTDSKSKILLDGIDNKSIGTNILRSSIAYIPRETAIFEDSVKKNLDPLGKIQDHLIWEALEITGLKNIVEAFPEGLRTVISKETRLLDVNQKHLLMLTRALLRKKSKILIMEDAHSDINTETEQFIHQTV